MLQFDRMGGTGVGLTYVEDWHSVRVGQSEGGGNVLVSRCVSLHHMLEERNDANEDKHSLWAPVS